MKTKLTEPEPAAETGGRPERGVNSSVVGNSKGEEDIYESSSVRFSSSSNVRRRIERVGSNNTALRSRFKLFLVTRELG